jgi:hypothetical protein
MAQDFGHASQPQDARTESSVTRIDATTEQTQNFLDAGIGDAVRLQRSQIDARSGVAHQALTSVHGLLKLTKVGERSGQRQEVMNGYLRVQDALTQADRGGHRAAELLNESASSRTRARCCLVEIRARNSTSLFCSDIAALCRVRPL